MKRVVVRRRRYKAKKSTVRRKLSVAKCRRYLRLTRHKRKTRVRRRRRRYQRRSGFRLVSKPFLIRHRSKSTPGKIYNRLAVVVKVGRKNVAFYQSTGTGTPGKVAKNEWVPFNGISRQGGGWFIKVPGKIPTGELEQTASWLKTHMRRKKPTKVFDEADYSDSAKQSADVNALIKQHKALYTPKGDGRGPPTGPFKIGTVNIGKLS